MKSFSKRLAFAVATSSVVALLSPTASANGRFPGATQLVLRGGRGVITSSFGVITSSDGFVTPAWSCELSLGYNPAMNNDLSAGIFGDNTIALAGPVGVTISTDQACTNPIPAGPLGDQWFVDVAVDEANTAHGLAISRGAKNGECGKGGAIFETLDNGKSWASLSTLPDGFCPLTLDSAHSDAQRLYVSGNVVGPDGNKLIARLLVSDDRGKNWTTQDIPNEARPFIGAIDPVNRDTLYVRTSNPPASGRLYVSKDAGKTYREIATLTGIPLQFFGVTGLALSPDGSKLAYGSVNDGLFVLPTAEGGVPEKRGDLPVMSLTWTSNGLYATSGPNLCGPFFVGVSRDEGRSFDALLPTLDVHGDQSQCGPSTPQATQCPTEWPAVKARLASCIPDGGTPPVDGGEEADAGAPGPKPPTLDCDCHVAGGGKAGPPAAVALTGLLLAVSRRRTRRTSSTTGGRR